MKLLYSNMPSQARILVDKIKSDPVRNFYILERWCLPHILFKFMSCHIQEVDFDNDWNLVTLWIGGNDLCAYCKGKVINNEQICHMTVT